MSEDNGLKEAVVYIRVSTEQQGKSKFGYEAQLAAIEEMARATGHKIVAVFDDVASGTKPPRERSGLRAALEESRARKCPILVASLSRLSRSVENVERIAREGRLDVLSPDLAGSFIAIRTGAAKAQRERQLISERTKEALAVRKATGIQLGNPKIDLARSKAIEANKERGIKASTRFDQLLTDARVAGAKTDRAVAEYLNIRNEPTSRGCRWTEGNVRRARLLAISTQQKRSARANADSPSWGIF